MEHGERIEGGDVRESGEGAEEERGAGSVEREAVAGSKREREAVSPAASRRYQEEEVTKEEVEGRTVSSTTARCRRTGLGTRGMRVRHCPSGSVSQG